MRILVAEDEPRIAAAVARGLRREGMAVDVAPDGAAALYKARVYPYDVVVLDRDLPQLHGDEVCRTLSAEQPRTKVLMLTAARSTDVLEALLEAQGTVVTTEALLERVWDELLDPLSNTVRMTVMTLRRKLGDPPLIETVRGSGYRV